MAAADAEGRNQILDVAVDGRRVTVGWGDGHESRFHAIWLRYNCECEACGATTSGIRHLKLTDIPADIEPASAALDGAGRLALAWPPDGHATVYDAAWLRAHCYSGAERARRRFAPRLWGPEIADALPEQDWDAVRGEAGHLRMLEQVRDYGFAVIRGAPADTAATDAITDLVGVVRVTNYGSIYDFIAKPEPLVKGDTGARLEPHTDEPYRHWPPAITFFHVIEASADAGGRSIVVDGFRVGEQLRAREPAAFDLLSRVPQPFHRLLDGERDFRSSARIFSLDEGGAIAGFRLLDRATAPLDAHEDLIEPYFAALRALLERLYDEAEQLLITLTPGDVLIFNNQRVLHGRTAFDRVAGGRFIRSCHVDLDEFHSRLRMLQRRLGRDEVDTVLPVGAAP